MALRIEIVGDSPASQRLMSQLLALKGFEVSRSSSRGTGGRSIVEVGGSSDGSAMLHEDARSGAIEAFPVLTLSVRKEA